MDLQQLIADYGYLALLIGTFLEGETILIVAGFAAKREMLSLPWVIAVATAGTLLGDQFFFYIGRWKGLGWIEKRPLWKARAARLRAMLEKHRVLVVLGYRFLYGLRAVTPFVLGASGFRPVAFAVLNVIASIVWAIAFGWAGYLLGHLYERVVDRVKAYELWALGVLAGIALAAWLTSMIRAAVRDRRARLAERKHDGKAAAAEGPKRAA